MSDETTQENTSETPQATPEQQTDAQEKRLSYEVGKRRQEARDAEQETAELRRQLDAMQQDRAIRALHEKHPNVADVTVIELCPTHDLAQAEEWANRFEEVAKQILRNRWNSKKPRENMSSEDYRRMVERRNERLPQLKKDKK